MPLIHLLRHGEAQHNASHKPNLLDPDLTPKGESECRALADTLSRTQTHPLLLPQITHLVSSPSHRTIRTSALVFSSILDSRSNSPSCSPSSSRAHSPPLRNPPNSILLNATFMESGNEPCNAPSALSVIKQRHGQLVDTALLETQGDFVHRGRDGPYDASKTGERTRRARVWLRTLAQDYGEDTKIVVVSHGAFLQVLDKSGPAWRNAEMRTYTFVDWKADDDEAMLQRVSEI
ncbi:phosphoglycerate mutase [Seiridium cupressi]